MVYQGVLVTVITLAAYFIGHYMEAGVWEITQSADGMTMAFLTMSMAEIFHSFNMRCQRKSALTLHSHNLVLWGGARRAVLLLTTAVHGRAPASPTAFGFDARRACWSMLVALADWRCWSCPWWRLVKACQRAYAKHRAHTA